MPEQLGRLAERELARQIGGGLHQAQQKFGLMRLEFQFPCRRGAVQHEAVLLPNGRRTDPHDPCVFVEQTRCVGPDHLIGYE